MKNVFEFCRTNAQMIADNAPTQNINLVSRVFAVWEEDGEIKTDFRNPADHSPINFIGFSNCYTAQDVLNEVDYLEQTTPAEAK
ncbi:MAG: hypothetical protein V4714_08345 [Bacteroidota bacterium]